jgi:hypothetical protein
MANGIIGPAADKPFGQLLAEVAQDRAPELVSATMRAFLEGEPSAIKLVMGALVSSQYDESAKFPIPDDRFEAIVLAAADRIRSRAA